MWTEGCDLKECEHEECELKECDLKECELKECEHEYEYVLVIAECDGHLSCT